MGLKTQEREREIEEWKKSDADMLSNLRPKNSDIAPSWHICIHFSQRIYTRVRMFCFCLASSSFCEDTKTKGQETRIEPKAE